MLVHLLVAGLACIEVFYALRTREVSYPVLGIRHAQKDSALGYWTLMAFWSILICFLIYQVGIA